MGSRCFSKYVEALTRSRLIEEERLAAVLENFGRFAACDATAEDLGRFLVEGGLVTSWQHERLARGAWRGFFLGKYKLLKQLGAGTMSGVFLAEHMLWRTQAALKVLHPRRAENPSYVERFLRESRALGSMEHPHVVRVFDCDFDGRHYFLAMEYVEGLTAFDLVRCGGPLAARHAAHLAAQAAIGLEFSHRKGFVHRDVKPSNLLVSKHGVLKVADLGVARLLEHVGPSLTVADGCVVGTVDYLPPEQAVDSHEVTGKADVYSLGCTLYYMVSGRPPFAEGSTTQRLLRHQVETAAPLHMLRRDVPTDLSRCCERLMAKSPKDRPDMREAARMLRRLAMQGSSAVTPELPPSRPAWVGQETIEAQDASTMGSVSERSTKESADRAEMSSMSMMASAPYND